VAAAVVRSRSRLASGTTRMSLLAMAAALATSGGLTSAADYSVN
jgi:hypothetical protein